MKKLYAPWRSSYTQDTAHTKNENAVENDCVFCNQFKEHNDEDYFILRRFEHNIIMLNKFPYNAGHLLIMPVKHIATLHAMPQEARAELMELVTHSVEIIQEKLHAHGANVGTNLGKAAGASIPSHLHMHVLPRFTGDTNFLPALAQTKVISFDLTEIYNRLKPVFNTL